MVVAKKSYEDSRRKRVEGNKKRMEASISLCFLKLPKLPLLPNPLLRSRPNPVWYRNKWSRTGGPLALPTSLHLFTKKIFGRKRNLSNLVLASSEAVAEAEEKAGKLVWGLPPGCPIFTKSMQPSHVAGGFWLGLPSNFSERNLPSHDAVMTLIDEDGDGWKGFAVAHHLAYGDALVFPLIGRTTFKVKGS